MVNSEEFKSDDNNKEESVEKDDIDPELRRLRLKRMQQIMAMQKKEKPSNNHVETTQQKLERVLKIIMMPDAYAYFKEIERRDSKLYSTILGMIIPPDIMAQIDVLLMYMAQGMLRTGVITLIDIQQIERRILGIGPKITVKKRNEEATSLGSFLKDNDD